MLGVSPEGNLITNHRKKHLYHIDKTWASEGLSFTSVDLVIRGKEIKAGLGICMDINPY